MKSTDLMIGDWIMYKSDAPENAFPIKVDCNIFYNELHKWEDRFEAIQLTPEILEKNGLNKCDDMEWCRVTHEVWEFGDNFYLYYDPYYNSFYIGTYIGDKNSSDFITDSIKIEYVHELQHALRLCGIEKEIIL